MRKINVLISPSHYYLDDKKAGSEFSWIAKILSSFLRNEERLNIKIITGFVKDFSTTKNIVEIKKSYGITILDAISFTCKNFTATSKLLKTENFNIIHHMLPFSIGVTCDLNFLFRSKKKFRFILGPVQSPHSIKSSEEFSFSEQGFNISFKNKIIQKTYCF